MNQLQVIEYQNQRVLMTSQLSESYETDEKRVSENFSRNKNRYSPDKHYFLLEGNELRVFKQAYPQFAETLKFVSILYLWTEKGAWLHAKSLNTDKAWEAYEMLVDDYYKVKNSLPQPKSSAEMLLIYAQQFVDQDRRLKALEEKTDAVETGVKTLVTGLIEKPTPAKVTDLVNAYVREARLGHNEVYNKVYSILHAQYGIDVKRRVENERQRINEKYFEKTGRYYAEATLKQKVNGIDIMTRMGVLDKFYKILSGMMTKIKSHSLV